MSALPKPLTPPECDLRGMPYMPLDLVRLFDSDFYALSSGDEFKAALTLWGKSFYQIPAASLPDDERLLAYLSGARRWGAVKDMALRGWIKCADGRLYHPIVAEKAAEAWAARLARRARTEAARAARQRPVMPFEEHEVLAVTEAVTEAVTGPNRTEQKQTEGKTEEKTEDSYRLLHKVLDEEAGFEQFWQAYPRKIGKGQARRAFQLALRKTTQEVMIQAVRCQRFDPRERFQPYPATWLQGERWLDEVPQGDPVLRAAGLAADTPTDKEWSLLQ